MKNIRLSWTVALLLTLYLTTSCNKGQTAKKGGLSKKGSACTKSADCESGLQCDGQWRICCKDADCGTTPQMEKFRASVNRLCACKTSACAETAKLGLRDVANLPKWQISKLGPVISQSKRCASKITHPAVATMQDLTKKACACKDVNCASKVTRVWADWARKNVDVKVSKSDGAKIKNAAERYAECIKNAMSPVKR